jgi:hypothetical protein
MDKCAFQMGDFFLKNNKEMNSENQTMRKAALAAMPSGPVPCAAPAGSAGQRVEIYDPREGKKRKLDPYSANAKELYRFYIRELGFDETWIAPLDLDYQKSSGRFTKREKPKEKPMITERSAYKGYLRCFKLHNYQARPVLGILYTFTLQYRAVVSAQSLGELDCGLAAKTTPNDARNNGGRF